MGSTHTDQGGGFRLGLHAGRYVIRVVNIGGYRSTVQQPVNVDAGSIVGITLTLETGIR